MNLTGNRRWFFLFSFLVILPGVISLLIPPRLYLGIEFTGGSTLSIEFASPVSEVQVRERLVQLGHPEAVVQGAGERAFFARTSALREADIQADKPSERQLIKDALEQLAPVTRLDVSSVSGVVAKDTVRNAFVAVVVASIGILFYITWAFRHMPNPFRYGLAAVIAQLHDALFVIGTFSILGKLVNLEVDTLFITGLLTVIGYSVNDTVVVFDRLRENIARMPAERLDRNVNNSMLQTMGRSLNTLLTTLFAVVALLLLGGESIRNFMLVLLIGLTSGTYSSIFIASQLLVAWESGDWGKLLRRLRLLPSRSQT